MRVQGGVEDRVDRVVAESRVQQRQLRFCHECDPMQLRLAPAAVIYLGSYLPLSLMLLIQDLEFKASEGVCDVDRARHLECLLPLKHPVLALAFAGVCLCCFLVTLAILKLLPKKDRIQIVETKHVPADLINYTFPYILAFATLDFDDTGKLLGFAVFLLWIFWTTYRSGQILLNPVLAALGWKLYEIKYEYLGMVGVHVGRMLSTREIITGGLYTKGDLQDVMVARRDGL